MTAKELRQKYLKFFKKKGHSIIPSASLIPENDPTVLFTTAGMHPLTPYLLGEKHPQGKRLVNFQKCIRTSDIDEVGNETHLTFFEMLGNWSLGDYFKKEAIEYSWEFLTSPQWLDLEKNKLAISVFKGDENAPFDEEIFEIWKKIGIPEQKIAKLSKEDNWWGPAGMIGPCGPDTEMFYWVGDKNPPDFFDPKNKNWVEIWNDVFMQYNKQTDGNYLPLKQRNVDTGMGLERTLAVLNNKKTVYETELFLPIIQEIEKLSSKNYNNYKKAMRIITDHLRAATFILGDEKGIVPSNLDQGYVLRRLIRRALRYGKMIGIKEVFTFKVAEIIIDLMSDVYPELKKNKEFIIEQLIREEEKFKQTLEKGLKEFKKIVNKLKNNNVISGSNAFILFSTYGFPLEITKELAQEKRLKVEEKEFQEEFKKHQELSRKGAEQRFRGGLADHSEITIKYHTATHLLQAALRQVLGDHVKQKGSNITTERLRFDFSHPQKMTPEEIKKVEQIVNKQIKNNLLVICEEKTVEEAKKDGAIGLFEHKYGEKVKVYLIGSFSKEICGGPHIKNTGKLGHFKIIKEEASSSGVRRIKAVLE